MGFIFTKIPISINYVGYKESLKVTLMTTTSLSKGASYPYCSPLTIYIFLPH